jgi:tetratricopeptide (TPR) repeat protein
MKRLDRLATISVAVLMTGCGMANPFVVSKTTSTPVVDKSNPTVGSPDYTTSGKPVNPTKIHLAYAAWHEQTGDLPEARDSYKKVLDKDPRDVDALLGLARIDRAYGRIEEADKQLKKIQKMHPRDARVFVAVGQAHADKHEWEQALASMKKACELNPYDSLYQFHLAVVEANSGDMEQAFIHFKRSVGEAEAHFNVGYVLKQKGLIADSEAHLVQALKMKPDLKQAQTALAALRSGETDEVMPASFKDAHSRR